ncbi:MAG: type II toxin-antitoxin system VapC family toxin [Leptolyngbyaceae cyanobacterium SL_5_14]|nr:type II toxin-antitoxin system VapC family toxin [Leptolyngbyaceae cyanobacterium SL_5_14]
MLLDTHTLLWFLNDDSRLPNPLKQQIETTETVFVSIASIWEISIKVNIGKLTLLTPLEMMKLNMASLKIQELTITFEDAVTYVSLPLKSDHRDPFDRILVAQAANRSLVLVSRDVKFDAYSIQRVWA